MSNPNRILLVTLVHPDFLPPVYATAQVLRDEGYKIDIVTFESLVPTVKESAEGITIREIGKYHDQPFYRKLALRRKFQSVIKDKLREHPALIISFCSFSFLCAEAKKKKVPHAYIALEIDNFPETFRQSPLTFLRIRRAFSKIPGAELLATPSAQRSAWLAGRCGLRNIPYTIQNTSYYTPKQHGINADLLKMVPDHFLSKGMFLYTGRINSNYSLHEIAIAFGKLNDDNAVLVITGFRANDTYCVQLAQIVEQQANHRNILLLPVIPRQQLLALQQHADIGICFLQERADALDTQMAAPNKIGEYIANGLYLLTNRIVYTAQFRKAGVATLIDQPTVDQIKEGMADALSNVRVEGFTERIETFYRDEYCMQQQARPIIEFLKKHAKC